MSSHSPAITSRVEARLNQPRTLAAIHSVKLLARGYLAVSLLTIAVMIVLNHNAAIAPAPVWVRGLIVVLHAAITLAFAVRMARGSRVGYTLLRLSSAGMLVAIAVILAIPGDFPLWFKIDQGICGVLLLGVIMVLFGKQVRSVFAKQ
jgi:hypothetical protein